MVLFVQTWQMFSWQINWVNTIIKTTCCKNILHILPGEISFILLFSWVLFPANLITVFLHPVFQILLFQHNRKRTHYNTLENILTSLETHWEDSLFYHWAHMSHSWQYWYIDSTDYHGKQYWRQKLWRQVKGPVTCKVESFLEQPNVGKGWLIVVFT